MTSIPYRLAPREDTGTNNGRLAMWLFLASEVLFFGSLISSYLLLRLGASDWPRGADRLEVGLATFNTLLLISTSVSMMRAYERAKNDDVRKSRQWLLSTAALGTVFVAIKLFEWQHKLSAGIRPADDMFYALYFTLTGVHLLHLIAGIVVVCDLLLRARRIEQSAGGLFAHRVELVGIYWHFVDLVWLVLFPILYLT